MINVICCLLFLVFGFLYLFSFQGDVMNMAQHAISSGRTTYHAFIFSILVILGLAALGLVLTRLLYVPIRFRALLWFPSYWILGIFTDVHLPMLEHTDTGGSLFGIVLMGVLSLVAFFLVRLVHEDRGENSSLSSLLWPNMLILAISLGFTAWAGNTNRPLHYELRLEHYALRGEFEKLLENGIDDPTTTRPVMAIRAYALSQQGEMGNKLFYYPVNIGSKGLIPSTADTLRPVNLPQLLREHLGGFPISDMSSTHFLEFLAAKPEPKEAVKDYLLCSYLLDKDLNTFVDSLIAYYGPNDSILATQTTTPTKSKKNKKAKAEPDPILLTSLPTHFAEALLLYSRLNDHPKATTDDKAVYENFLEFSKCRALPTKEEREAQCRRLYNQTYWFYYYFE